MAYGLDEALKDITKRYGDTTVFLPTVEDILPPNVISTGSLMVDHYVLGVGGFSRGRVTEVSGPEGCGKTTLCLQAMREAQEEEQKVVFVDAELKLDLVYADALGLDVENLVHVTPENGEVALEVVDTLCHVDDLAMVVFDSAAALGSKLEQEKFLSDNADVAKVPRVLNKFLRRNIKRIKENDIAIVFTNQLRDKIGTPFPMTQTPGGRGLKHYSSVRMAMQYVGTMKDKNEVKIGQKVKVWTTKNNVAPPHLVAVVKMWYGRGIWKVSEVLDIGVESGIIGKRGSFYYYGEERLAQGELNALNHLDENPERFEEIREECEQWLKDRLV